MSANSLKHCSGVSEPIKLYLCKSYCLPVLSYALESLQLGITVIRQLNVYWNSVYRKIFSYMPWESVRYVMKCLGKKNLEFIYYERKLCFLHSMLLSDNVVVRCIMSVYVYSSKYIDLCKNCELSAQENVSNIKRSLYEKFCGT